MAEGSNAPIPFGKAARVGNYRVWRSRYITVRGGGKENVECLHVTTVDGLWDVRIPSTWEIYGDICLAYNDFTSGDENLRTTGEKVLDLIFSNMLYVSCISNGHYHQALNFIATIYANPELLTDKDKFAKVVDDFKELKDMFLEWRKVYVDNVVTEPTEEDIMNDNIADKAAEIISNG